MGRWDPDARGRLAQAALELYADRGYDRTTVAEIAQRAGLTERTFFRYFADKREVLFDGSDRLQAMLLAGLTDASDTDPAIDQIAAAVEGIAPFFDGRRAWSRRRAGVITANAVLLERELIKLASLSAALADALRGRGVTEPAASLAAEAGVAVFRVAFDRWVADPEPPAGLADLIRASFAELKAVTAGR